MPANGIIPTPGTNLPPTFRTPGANTNHPLTECRFGNATITPPGRVRPTPNTCHRAYRLIIVKSLPASDVTVILVASRQRERLRAPGLSILHRAPAAPARPDFRSKYQNPCPPFRMVCSSGACSSPSTVKSATKPLPAKAATAGGRSRSTSLAPADRTGTDAPCGGVGIATWKARGPAACSANSVR